MSAFHAYRSACAQESVGDIHSYFLDLRSFARQRKSTMPQITSVKAEYLILLSFLMTAAVVVNAFQAKKQFYPSVVYLTKSSSSLAVSDPPTYRSFPMSAGCRFSTCKHSSLSSCSVNSCRKYSLDHCVRSKRRFVFSSCIGVFIDRTVSSSICTIAHGSR